jgi:holo-[acyl-carrier protein] synthase
VKNPKLPIGAKDLRAKGVGIDVVRVARFGKVSKAFLSRVFTNAEREYCLSKPCPAQHFAARFAAKEAVVKACTGLKKKILPGNVEILNSANGAPKARVEGMPKLRVLLSVSHDGEYAAAVAIRL